MTTLSDIIVALRYDTEATRRHGELTWAAALLTETEGAGADQLGLYGGSAPTVAREVAAELARRRFAAGRPVKLLANLCGEPLWLLAHEAQRGKRLVYAEALVPNTSLDSID